MNVTETIAAAKKATEAAREIGLSRIKEIRTERKQANAKWSAEEKEIKESLRVRVGGPRKPRVICIGCGDAEGDHVHNEDGSFQAAPKPRKPKPQAAPEADAKKKSA